MERCRAGLRCRSRKPVSVHPDRGFESHSLAILLENPLFKRVFFDQLISSLYIPSYYNPVSVFTGLVSYFKHPYASNPRNDMMLSIETVFAG